MTSPKEAAVDELQAAIDRLTDYLNEMDRVDTGPGGPQYPDDVHGINDFVLCRTDVRRVLAGLKDAQASLDTARFALEHRFAAEGWDG